MFIWSPGFRGIDAGSLGPMMGVGSCRWGYSLHFWQEKQGNGGTVYSLLNLSPMTYFLQLGSISQNIPTSWGPWAYEALSIFKPS